MTEKRESGDLRRVSGFDAMERAGDFWIAFAAGRNWFHALLPGNSFHGDAEGVAYCSIPIALTPAGEEWHWDGNYDAPTLSPSVWNHDHWHGFIRAGRFESC